MRRFAIAILGACLAFALNATTAIAQPYGALAYDRSKDAVGWATGYPSKRGAGTRALEECAKRNAKHCELIVVFSGYKCGAYAIGAKNDAYGAGPTPEVAKRNAVAECGKGGELCRAVMSACNPEPPRPRPPGSNDIVDEIYRTYRPFCRKTMFDDCGEGPWGDGPGYAPPE